MKRCLLLSAALWGSFLSVYAHVGSPDVAMEGMAGPYHVLVNIKPPDVIPGTASVTIFVQNGAGIRVFTQPIYFFSGRNGAPSADALQPVAGQPGQFQGIVWMMTDGSSSILLTLEGSLGKGELVVPIVAISTAQKKLPLVTGYSLLFLGILLFILMVTLIGASVGEGITGHGETLPPQRKRSKRIAFAVAALFASLIVYGGNAWWRNAEENYRQLMFKPMHASYTITPKQDGSNELSIQIDIRHAQRRSTLSYLVPDHGKLMHLYIMRWPAMDVVAHVHPIRTDSAGFRTNLPPLPRGRYLAFADIVYNTGFAETLKDEFSIDHDLTDSLHKLDQDDAYAFVSPVGGDTGGAIKLQDGSTMVLENGPDEIFESGALTTLHVAVYDENKQPARLAPYMGMMGHAAVVRDDGSVFIHIHPVGTYSMAAQENLLGRMDENGGRYRAPEREVFRDSIDRLVRALREMSETERNVMLMKQMNRSGGIGGMGAMPGMGSQPAHNRVSFPYSFPQPGSYRIWVQVKRNGRILTAAFDRVVR
jgi:hypothetical protein